MIKRLVRSVPNMTAVDSLLEQVLLTISIAFAHCYIKSDGCKAIVTKKRLKISAACRSGPFSTRGPYARAYIVLTG